jgi:hypothetical protein
MVVMPVMVRWYEENAILLVEYVAPVMIEERQAGSMKMIAYFDSANRPIHVIGDWRRARDWPSMAGVTSQSLEAMSHKNMGRLAVLGISPILENWVEVLAQLSGMQYLVADSVEDAARQLRALS